MSEERRQWLQEAMSAAFRGQREEVEQMKNCLRVLSQPTPSSAGEAELATDQQEREGALELLADLCENMDNAADFCQLSGMHLLVGRYLEAGPAGLRWRAAQLIGTCSQNVAAIQEQVLGLGALRKLLRLLDRDPCDAVRVKALFAISCLVREQEAGLLQFLRLDGFSVLMRAMQQQVQKLKVKSAFLLQNLLVGHPEHKGTLCAMGMVQQLVALVRTEHSPFHEHVLGALCSLVTDFPRACGSAGSPSWAWRNFCGTGASCCSSTKSTRRSWSSVKSCYRPVSPPQLMTAWIGETRWLLSPSSWEPQASCLPLTHEALSQRREGPCWCRARACQPVSAQPPGWVLKKALAPWVPPLRHSQSTPFSCAHRSSRKGAPPPPPASLPPLSPRLQSALVGDEGHNQGV